MRVREVSVLAGIFEGFSGYFSLDFGLLKGTNLFYSLRASNPYKFHGFWLRNELDIKVLKISQNLVITFQDPMNQTVAPAKLAGEEGEYSIKVDGIFLTSVRVPLAHAVHVPACG
ncbi:hypothetical protein ACFX1Z_027790 [Malus domestica]